MHDLAIIESILRNRRHFFLEIRDGIGLGDKIRAMLVSSLVFFAVYGAVLGSSASVWQALSSAVKLPVLFLATLLICAPTLYFFHVLFGSSQGLRQTIALMLTAITVTSVLLLSFCAIVIFYLLTTAGYQFFKLLNVGIFAICGAVGVLFLSQGLAIVAQDDAEGAKGRGCVTWLWVVLYAFVGSQMAWTLRPFIGAPSMPFELFRNLGGNFYGDVFASLGEVLGFFTVR
ncbi:MAG: actin-binding WH2 domain-containing protein [Anaerolineae bacterium]